MDKKFQSWWKLFSVGGKMDIKKLRRWGNYTKGNKISGAMIVQPFKYRFKKRWFYGIWMRKDHKTWIKWRL